MAVIDSVKLPDNSTYEVADNYSGYQKATLTTPLTINGTQETTVEGALGGLNDYGDALKGELSHENLVDNPFFTVNQRGATTVTSGYGADRWKYEGGNEAVFSSSGVTLNSVLISQHFEKQLPNGVYTASARFSDGTIRKGTAIKSNDTSAVRLVDDADFKLTYEPSLQRFDINTASMSSGLTVRAVKLELGSVSTLANDVAPDYALELAKCRASTADPSDTYANKGNLVNYADLTAIHATGSTNTTGAQIDAGTFFYLNGQFCKALQDIGAGNAFTLNTNYKEDTVASELTTVEAWSIAPDNYAYSTNVFEFYRAGKVVYFTGCNLSDTLPVGSSTIIASLPVKLRPIKTWQMRGLLDPLNPNDYFALSISSNGSIEVYRYTANSANTVGAFSQSGSYIANN